MSNKLNRFVRERLTVPCRDRKGQIKYVKVEAYRCGPLAVTTRLDEWLKPEGAAWVITHVPSGRRMTSNAREFGRAIALCYKLLGLYDWGLIPADATTAGKGGEAAWLKAGFGIVDAETGETRWA